jgi:serine/threonine-protein kinase
MSPDYTRTADEDPHVSPDVTHTADEDPLADVALELLRHIEARMWEAAAAILALFPDLGAVVKARDAVAIRARFPNLRALLPARSGVDDLLHGISPEAGREPDLATNERFVGEYELLERIDGNMAIVYRARHLDLPLEVAVKLLVRENPSARERFRLEAEAMARLRHPNIVRLMNVGRGDGQPFFSMDWYAGGTLETHLARYQADPKEAARVVGEVARAVHFGHLRGVLHRDLKPSNILLDEDGRPHVADFGLAVLLEDAARDRSPAGTPQYMAPEAFDGEATVQSDVYGLGGVLYSLLTGRPPIRRSATRAEARDRARRDPPPPPTTLSPKVDADLNAICLKCLKKNPEERYPTAEALAADLDRWHRREPVEARPLGLLGRAAYNLRDARLALEVAAGGSFLLAQAVLVFLTNSVVYLLLRAGAAEPWLWAALFASYLPLLVAGLRDQLRATGPVRPGVRHLWAAGLGHAAACLAVFVAHRVTTGPEPVQWLGAGLVAVAGMNALVFTLFGSLFSWRLYLFAPVWLVAAVAMGADLAHAPLIYAAVMGCSSALVAAHLRTLARSAGPTADCGSRIADSKTLGIADCGLEDGKEQSRSFNPQSAIQ